VGETSWLTGSSVNGNTDVDDVSNVAEQLVEISVGHLESEVADEERLGGLVLFAWLVGGLVLVVDDHTAAFEDGFVLGFDGCGGLVDGLKLDISKSAKYLSVKLQSEQLKKNSKIGGEHTLCSVLEHR
jgi:hypothetical protein